jgi:hypothetical protein
VTKSSRIYTVYISGVNSLAAVESFTIAIVRIINSTTKTKLPIEFAKYIDVFDTEKTGVLLAHSKNIYAINLDRNKPSFGPLYNLSIKELEILRTYLNAALAKRWIRRFTSPTGAPVLFTLKKDGGLRLYIDYRGLIKIMIKNRYPLSLINKTLNLKDIYYRIRIRKDNK